MIWKWVLGLVAVVGIVGGGMWWVSRDGGKGWLRPYVISFNVPKKDEFGEIKKKLEEKLVGVKGKWAVDVYELGEKKEYGLNQGEIMPAASIMKLPALVAVAGKKDETWVLEKADTTPGSGPLQFVKPGTKVTVERVMTELGKKSDNTAWVMINRRLGYPVMERVIEEWGLKNTSYRELTTTAEDVGTMMRKINERQELWQYLEDSIYEDRIILGLPEDVRLVHKVGTDAKIWSDAGIVMGERPFILVILNKEAEREEAQKLVPELTKIIWEYEVERAKEEQK